MSKFLIKLFFFISPIFILLCISSYILWQSKENFYEIDEIIKKDEKYLIGYAYNGNNYSYLKWAYINLKENKCVWSIGASRVLQFRENMFDSTFYNAGYTIKSINDFRSFLKSIPEDKHPKYIIVGLDHFMFNSSMDVLLSSRPQKPWKNSFTFYPNLSIHKNVYKDLIARKYSLNSFQRNNLTNKIGLSAATNVNGFRNDGSFYYAAQISKLASTDKTLLDYNYFDTFDRIKKGYKYFDHGESISVKALLELTELLKYCKKHKIEIVGFLPPFSDRVYNKMIVSKKYGYLSKIFPAIKPIFKKYKFEVYDFSKVSMCNSNDYETIDGIHAGELTYQKLLINILESGSILNKVANPERLREDLLKRKNNYILYDY